MTYPDFEARWKPAGGAERANYDLFLQDLCDLIGVARSDPTTDNPTQDAYVLERAVEFNDYAPIECNRPKTLYFAERFLLLGPRLVSYQQIHQYDLPFSHLGCPVGVVLNQLSIGIFGFILVIGAVYQCARCIQ